MNAKREFKRRFFPIYAAKSRFQGLRECGNGRGTQWNREIREEWCLDRSIWIDFNSDAYKREEHIVYRAKFRNRPIVSIDGYDGTVHRGPFRKYHSRPITMDGPDVIVRETL